MQDQADTSLSADEARKQEIDREKHAQLKEQKEGKNEWKQALASESESVVSSFLFPLVHLPRVMWGTGERFEEMLMMVVMHR